MMDGAGQSESTNEQPAPAATTPPPSVAQQQNSGAANGVVSASPQPPQPVSVAPPAPASPQSSSAMDGVETTAQPPQPAALSTAQPSSPSSHLQTAEDANKRYPPIAGPESLSAVKSQSDGTGDKEQESLRTAGPMTAVGDGARAEPGNSSSKPSGTGTVASPQQPTPGPLQPHQQSPQDTQHPLPHPQHHLHPQHPPAVPTPAPAPAPPVPAAHHHHGIQQPQPQPPQPQPQPQAQILPRSHQLPAYHHHHPPPPPPPQQQHAPHLQQPAPHPQTHAQIPHQYQQQHQYHHHQPPLQPPPAAPVTPLPPLQHQSHVPQFHSHHQPQPQPQPLLLSQAPGHVRSVLSKPIIMDPPAARKAAQAQQQQRGAVGFPSPTQDHAAINSKFVDDCTRMNFAIQQSLPEAVRRIVRDHWEKCLLGSEFHQAFVLNASIHHALPTITQRAVRDFGNKMVAESKHELMAHFTTEALDEVADIIISKASDSFLDKCLEKRLLTIEAQPLINALAKAERLGYEAGDIIQDGQNERVIPKEAYPGAAVPANGHQARPSQPPPSHPPSTQPPPAQSQSGRPPLQCLKCFRTFAHTSAFDYHAIYDVCRQVPPTASGFQHSCPHCGQGFVNLDDLQEHLDSLVCGNFGPPPTVVPNIVGSLRSAPSSQPSPAATAPTGSQTPTANGVPRRQQITPSVTRAAATPGSSGSGIAADPYGHLTEEQIQKMNEELLAAEEKYAPRFAEANLIPDENARKARIEGLRNSFGTKQSMIRKKYGVRLRERRTKAEIMAERERMGLQKAEKEKERASRTSTPHGLSSSSSAHLAPRPSGGSGWTAANTPRANAVWEEHDAKRRRVDEGGGYQTPYKALSSETPTRKPLSVSEIGGGLSGAAATAAMHDPTLPPPSQPTKVYEQSGARVEIHEPSKTDTAASGTATPNGHSRRASTEGRSVSNEKPLVVIDDDSSSDDDDEDIPSTLPAHVRKSLASSGGSSTSLLQQHP